MQCTRLILKWYLSYYFQIHVLLFHKFIQNHWKTSQANRALNKINICCKWGCCLALYCMSIIKIEVSFSRLVATSCRLFWSLIDSRLVATSRIRKIIEQLVVRLVVSTLLFCDFTLYESSTYYWFIHGTFVFIRQSLTDKSIFIYLFHIHTLEFNELIVIITLLSSQLIPINKVLFNHITV